MYQGVVWNTAHYHLLFQELLLSRKFRTLRSPRDSRSPEALFLIPSNKNKLLDTLQSMTCLTLLIACSFWSIICMVFKFSKDILAYFQNFPPCCTSLLIRPSTGGIFSPEQRKDGEKPHPEPGPGRVVGGQGWRSSDDGTSGGFSHRAGSLQHQMVPAFRPYVQGLHGTGQHRWTPHSPGLRGKAKFTGGFKPHSGKDFLVYLWRLLAQHIRIFTPVSFSNLVS